MTTRTGILAYLENPMDKEPGGLESIGHKKARFETTEGSHITKKIDELQVE